MLIVAVVMALIGLAALVTALVTSNGVLAWVCIAAGVIGVVLLVVDTLRVRQERHAHPAESPAVDAAAHRGHDREVQRENMHGGRALHSGTGSRGSEFTKEDVLEALRNRRGQRPIHAHRDTWD